MYGAVGLAHFMCWEATHDGGEINVRTSAKA